MNYPKCTLTDREMFDCAHPFGVEFNQVKPEAHAQIRRLVDKTIAHMIDKGQLAVVQPAPVPAETPLTVEALITILEEHQSFAAAGYMGTCERVVRHKHLLNRLHDLRRT